MKELKKILQIKFSFILKRNTFQIKRLKTKGNDSTTYFVSPHLLLLSQDDLKSWTTLFEVLHSQPSEHQSNPLGFPHEHMLHVSL